MQRWRQSLESPASGHLRQRRRSVLLPSSRGAPSVMATSREMWRYPKYDPIFCGRYVQTVRLLCEGARLKAGTWNGKRLCKRHLGKQDKKLLSRMPGRGMFCQFRSKSEQVVPVEK